MPYLLDRERAVWMREVVAVLRAKRQGRNSQLILRDGSLMDTRTRPGTLLRMLSDSPPTMRGLIWVNKRASRRA